MKLKSIEVKFEFDVKELFLDLTASARYDWNSHLVDGDIVKNALIISRMNSIFNIRNSHQELKFNLIEDDGKETSFGFNWMNDEQIPSECKGFFNGIRMFDPTDKPCMTVYWNTFMHMATLDSDLVEGLNSFLFKFGSSYYVSIGNILDYDELCCEVTKCELALIEYYAWKFLLPSDVSLALLDFPDAFLDFKSARILFEDLNTFTCQTIMTTNNVTLLDNDITRPDCCFIAAEDYVRSLEKSTDREIRFAHNLEKMYVNGVFD